jgi:hypothetical protein
MADHTSAANDALATQLDTPIGTPLPKTDTITINSGEAITRVNSKSEKKNSSEKQDNVDVDIAPAVAATEAAPTTLLTGSKLALAHVGFLL